MSAFVSGIGMISPLGNGISETKQALKSNTRGIRALSLFSTANNTPLPVGEIQNPLAEKNIPRTHQLARMAAAQAMIGNTMPPDGIVMGVTTGGMLTTEELLKNNASNPDFFQYHSPGSVSADLADIYACTGPVITVSTACSSGTIAIAIALELLRTGCCCRVLAGGADSLCRLTYYGFNSLQLIDPDGARPLDKNRNGMSVGEGAAILLLTSDKPENVMAEIQGAGISCDAYHPTAPDPEGNGALAAMKEAIADADISASSIDYINLHGTGTWDNDLSEARAIHSLFPKQIPMVSSTKGAFGHSLAAAGAIEAAVSAISISEHLAPGNTGWRVSDPELNLNPLPKPIKAPVHRVLSNSFGFGGNNASIVMGSPQKKSPPPRQQTRPEFMEIMGSACITGAGDSQKSFEMFSKALPCNGTLSTADLSQHLATKEIRRLKRFPIMAMALAAAAMDDSGEKAPPNAVFLGTGWGALAETRDFLTRLFDTKEQYYSPTDFVGSVHNSAAGRIAMKYQAKGANITNTNGDYSFEQALLSANLLIKQPGQTFFAIGADEYHPELSPFFDKSTQMDNIPSDGGGGLVLKKTAKAPKGIFLRILFYQYARNHPEIIQTMIDSPAPTHDINGSYNVVFAGIPKGVRGSGEQQLKTFLDLTDYQGEILDYRKLIGEYASASATATVMAGQFVKQGFMPGVFGKGKDIPLTKKGILVLGLGSFVTAMEIMPG